MQPIRYVCINAHEDGTVNHAEIGWGSDGERDSVVLPLPVWTDVAMGDLLNALAFDGGKYWLDSWATLLGVLLVDQEGFEELCVKVMERNERFRYERMSPELPFDQERF